MKGWVTKLVALAVSVAFLVGFSGMLTGHAYAQEKGAAAAGKAGAEAGAATAAGISTGTIVAGVIAAAAIAAIAAASGGGGGAIQATAPSTEQLAAQAVLSTLPPADVQVILQGLADDPNLAVLLANMDDTDIAWLLNLPSLSETQKEELKAILNNNQKLREALKTLAKNKEKFQQFQSQVKVLADLAQDKNKYNDKLKEFFDAVVDQGSKQGIIITVQHSGGGKWIVTTAHH